MTVTNTTYYRPLRREPHPDPAGKEGLPIVTQCVKELPLRRSSLTRCARELRNSFPSPHDRILQLSVPCRSCLCTGSSNKDQQVSSLILLSIFPSILCFGNTRSSFLVSSMPQVISFQQETASSNG
jgi:hypothetical protein